MTWLVWRQYRLQWAIAIALLAAFAAMELVSGLKMANDWHTLLRTCAGQPTGSSQDGPGGSCTQRNIVGMTGNDLRVLSVMVPCVLGMLWGAPLLAHEMETGTTSFAWTQAITRTRWLAGKAGLLLASAAIWAGAVSALITWWSGPENAQRADAFQPNYFDTQGIVPIGYAVFAMALGITAGALLRRTIPAIAITLGGFIGVRLLVDDYVRQHLLPPVTTIVSLVSTWSPPSISWIMNSGDITASGQVLTWGDQTQYAFDGVPSGAVPAACQKLVSAAANTPSPTPHVTSAAGECLAGTGIRQFYSYQPGYRYWPFQGLELSLYLLLAAALLAVTFYVVRRRDA